MNEHSAEVMVPILKYFNRNVKILPVTFKYLSLEDCEIASEGIYNLLKNYSNTLLLMSSDMNHFENSVVSKEKDNKAIEKILNNDPSGLYYTVAKYKISMCGVIPVTVGMKALLKFGKIKTQLIEYTNSGEVSGDFSSVVGYLGVRFYRDE
jgi:AmmeMemoRadiSam system protein B